MFPDRDNHHLDVPGLLARVGHPMAYRPWMLASLGRKLLDQFGSIEVDVMGGFPFGAGAARVSLPVSYRVGKLILLRHTAA